VLKQAEAAIGKPIVAEYGSARGNLAFGLRGEARNIDVSSPPRFKPRC